MSLLFGLILWENPFSALSMTHVESYALIMFLQSLFRFILEVCTVCIFEHNPQILIFFFFKFNLGWPLLFCNCPWVAKIFIWQHFLLWVFLCMQYFTFSKTPSRCFKINTNNNPHPIPTPMNLTWLYDHIPIVLYLLCNFCSITIMCVYFMQIKYTYRDFFSFI